MSLAPSLRHRVKRLEQATQARATLGIADRLRQARMHRHAMSPLARLVDFVDGVAEAVRSLQQPEQPDSMAHQLRQRQGRRHLIEIAELEASDLPEVGASAGQPYWALCEQRRRRESARKYLEASAELAAANPSEVAAVRAAEAAWIASL